MTLLSTSEVRTKIAAVLTRLRRTKKPVVITRQGKAEAVLLSIDRYNEILDLLEDREDELDASLGRRLQEERSAYIAAEGRDLTDLIAELDLPHVSG